MYCTVLCVTLRFKVTVLYCNLSLTYVTCYRRMDSTAVVDRSPCIKDFKLSMEYKYLVKQAPAGVYLLPERTCMR